MQGTRITKEGLKSITWDSNIREYVEEEVDSFVPKLRSACTIDMGVTLGEFFDAVDKHPDLKAFIGMYSWCKVDAFHKEAKRIPLKKSDLKYLRIYTHFECGEGQYSGFDGIGAGVEYDGGEGQYAVEFTPVNELAHLEVRIDRTCAIDKDYKTIETTETWFSLLDVLDAVYFEISFCGSPRVRDEKAADLQEMVKDIKDGTEKLDEWEEIIEDDLIQ